ncbi:acyl-CoA synthetase [soil metagenome]
MLGTGTLDDPEWKEAAATGTTVSFHAAHGPDRLAIVSPSGDRTFAQLDANANRLARALRSAGLLAGDGVALLCGNRAEYAEVWAATQRSGLRLTTINWHLTAGEAAYIAADSGAKALIADSLLAEVATAAAVDVPALRASLAVGGDIDGFIDYADALAAESGAALPDPVLGGTMLYTSGTTGRPKGVHRSKAAPPARALMTVYGYRPGADAHLCTGPLYHAAPLAFSLAVPLHCGVGVVLMASWDPVETLALIDAHSVTHTHMVPTMFHRLLALPAEVRDGYDVSSLRVVLHGAAPCPVPVKEALIDWLGPVVYEYYAATEGTGTFVDSHDWLAHPGTVGRAVLPGGVTVGDEDARPLPPGEPGVVWLARSLADPFEYHGDPAKTSSTYRGDWFTLGDIGHLDADGWLYLTDRSANLIISGGVNI